MSCVVKSYAKLKITINLGADASSSDFPHNRISSEYFGLGFVIVYKASLPLNNYPKTLMFIIWKGYGFLVPFITIAIVAVVSVISWKLFPATLFLGPCIGSFAAAAAVWFIGKKCNSSDKNRVMIDKQSGQEFLFKPDHSLFFIKMQYWAFIIAAIGTFLLLGTFLS